MKEHVLDIKEITDSREMLSAKPGIIVNAFVYILMFVLTVAVIWTYFGELEDYVKASGTIRPGDGISTIRNVIAGKVEDVFVGQGMYVNKGDILYTVETQSLILEEERLLSQKKSTEEIIENLKLLKTSILDGVNHFNINEQFHYYNIYEKYITDMELNLEQANNSKEDMLYYIKETEISLTMTKQNVENLKKTINDLELLKSSIIKRENLFKEDTTEYSSRYKEYEYTLLLYENNIASIKNSLERLKRIMDEGIVSQKEINDAVSMIENAQAELDKYKNEYEFRKKLYKDNFDKAKLVYQNNLKLFDVGGLAKNELDASKIAMDQAELELLKFENENELNIKMLESNLKQREDEYESVLKLQEIGGTDKQELYKLENQLVSTEIEVDKYTNDFLLNVNTSLEQNKKNLIELESVLNKTQAALNTSNQKQMNTEVISRKFELDKLVWIQDNITSNTERLNEINKAIDDLNININEASVKAAISGNINFTNEINRGDLLQSGLEIAVIVPETDTDYKMHLMVTNQNIASINIGQKIRYHVLALPYREYGALEGKVTKIGTDARVDTQSGTSYYLVEATIDNKELTSHKGVLAELRPGMICEAQVIVKSKKILHHLLEKIDLKD